MDLPEDPKPLTLDGQYIAEGNIENIRMIFFDLVNNKHHFLCRVQSYPHLMDPVEEFNHLCLIDISWGECGLMELIDLDGMKTLVRFYMPGRIEVDEIEKYENAIRQSLIRPRFELWFYENLGWTAKLIEIFAEELYEHRVTCLRNIRKLVVNRLGLIPYALSYFQIQPAPQIGISQIQPGNPQPQIRISQSQLDSPQPQAGISQSKLDSLLPQARISQIQPDNPPKPVWISQVELDCPRPQPGISQILPDTPQTQVVVHWDIPKEHPAEESDISLAREDQELLRLWNNGLTANEIGLRTRKTGKTVSNRLSILRGMYGEERIPLRKKQLGKVWDKLG